MKKRVISRQARKTGRMSKLAQRDPTAKIAHIDACLRDDVEYQKSAGFDAYVFENQAACEIALPAIDLSLQWLNKHLAAPLMIAPMTGGIERGGQLNRLWAKAAEHFRIPMSVGSQRVGIEQKEAGAFYRVRQDAPTALLFGNMGAGQLSKGWGVKEALLAVEMIEADALFIHFNAIQEAVQGGDVDFDGVLTRLSLICEALHKEGIPVFAREVGFGISAQSAKRLIDTGVKGIDCGGAGGTSWAKVEAICAKTERRRKMGQCFAEWGIPTAESLVQVRSVAPDLDVIATGGVRSGTDVAKAIALGATMAAMARPMLLAASIGEEALHTFIEDVLLELRICMFGIGAKAIGSLRDNPALVKLPRPF